MADSQVTVDVTPTTSLIAPPPNMEPLAAAILKSSENSAAATMTLAAALKPAGAPASLASGGNAGGLDGKTWLLVALIVWLAWK